MKIILLDKRNRFRDDARTRLLIDDDRNVELATDLSDSGSLGSAITRYKPDIVVVADNVYTERSAWDGCGAPVIGYITTPNGEDIFTQDGIPHFPAVSNATHLLNLLEGGLPEIKKPRPAVPANNPKPKTFQTVAPTVPTTQGSAWDNQQFSSSMGIQKPSIPETPVSSQSNSVNSSCDTNETPMFTPMTKGIFPAPQTAKSSPAQSWPLDADNTTLQFYQEGIQSQIPHPQTNSGMDPTPEYYLPTSDSAAYTSKAQSQQSTAPIYDRTTKEQFDAERSIRDTETHSTSVMEDIALRSKSTKTVAVYSAKGGVGKTTITTELATILSMTSSGRGNYRVCLVDCNVDFGDILTTLNLDNRGPNMTHWTADVRRRVQNGEDPNEIQYNRKEIEGYLQRVGSSTLYALVAPVTHEDSMDIRSEEPGIILRNIIQNGCFDFVICDTGNNTRDATVSALDAADVILMIATQDVSAVNCDKSFLQTMSRVGFDIDKIRLILNGVMPYKYTQVTVKDVEDTFPYPCIARFKRDPEVTRANNCSEPIVRNPNHDFTREMRKIVAYLTGRQIPEDRPKRGGILSIFKKKG